MKRTLLLLSALLLAVALAAPAKAYAVEEDVVRIQLDTVTGEAGKQVDLSVQLSNCAGVDSAQFDINYDSAALEFVSMTPGDLFAAQYTVINADTPGRIRVACASALGLSGAGTLMTLRFRLLTDAGSAVTISNGIITRVDASYNQTTALIAITDGGITVGTAPLPAPVVTPWVPATPIPSPTPTPSLSPSPAASSETAETQATNSPEVISEPAALSATVYYVGGGLLLAVVVLATIVVVSRKKDRS